MEMRDWIIGGNRLTYHISSKEALSHSVRLINGIPHKCGIFRVNHVFPIWSFLNGETPYSLRRICQKQQPSITITPVKNSRILGR